MCSVVHRHSAWNVDHTSAASSAGLHLHTIITECILWQSQWSSFCDTEHILTSSMVVPLVVLLGSGSATAIVTKVAAEMGLVFPIAAEVTRQVQSHSSRSVQFHVTNLTTHSLLLPSEFCWLKEGEIVCSPDMSVTFNQTAKFLIQRESAWKNQGVVGVLGYEIEDSDGMRLDMMFRNGNDHFFCKNFFGLRFSKSKLNADYYNEWRGGVNSVKEDKIDSRDNKQHLIAEGTYSAHGYMGSAGQCVFTVVLECNCDRCKEFVTRIREHLEQVKT